MLGARLLDAAGARTFLAGFTYVSKGRERIRSLALWKVDAGSALDELRRLARELATACPLGWSQRLL